VERPFLEEVGRPPGQLRIAFTTKSLTGKTLHPDCAAAVRSAARLCEELGHVVEEAAPDIDMNAMTSHFLAVFASGTAMVIEAFAMLTGRTPRESDFEGLTWAIYQQGKEVTAPQYQIAMAMLQIASRRIARFHEKYDCWLTSTLGTPPLRLGAVDVDERDLMKAMIPIVDYVPFTPIQNATGQPAISLPLYWNGDGLPIGVMFAGRFGDEATLFRLAAQLEQARPWKNRRPPVWG